MKKALALLLTVLITAQLLTAGLFVLPSFAVQALKRNIIADWDDPDRTPELPAGASVGTPYEDYEFGSGLFTGPNMISLTANTSSVGDTMLAMRVKSFEKYSATALHWTNMFVYDDSGKPKALKSGSEIYYIPTARNAADMVRFEKIVNGLYRYTTTNQTYGIEMGYDGWILFNIADFHIDWWNGCVETEPVSPGKISGIHFASDFADGTVVDEIQTFNGSAVDFKKVCGRRPSDPDEPETCKHTSMQHFAAEEATCQKAGNIEYWYCPDCKLYFADEKGENSIDSYVIPMKSEHSYQDGKCIWCGKSEVKPDPVVKAGKGHMLVDWDSAFPLSTNAETVENISGYGTSVIFDGSQLNILPQLSAGYGFKNGDNALAFYMIMPKGVSQSFHFMVLETSGEGYQLKDEVVYSLIDKNGTVTEKTNTGQTISLPGGYSGWVVLPLSSLEMHISYPNVDGVLTPEEINNIQYFAFDGDGPYYFDQFYALKTVDIPDFAGICNINRENVGEPPEPEKPPTELDSSDDENRTGILCDFDDVDFTTVQTGGEYTVKASGTHENYITWKADSMQTPFQVSFDAAGRTFDTAILMRFSVLSSKSYDLYFAVHDTLKPGKTELYQFRDKCIVYMIDSSGHFATHTTSYQKLTIDGGFDGWLLIPFSSLERHVGWYKHNQILNIENITAIQFWGGNQPGEFALDEIQTVPDLFKFATDHSDYVAPVANSVIINDFEKGEITQSDSTEKWSAYCKADTAVISADTDLNRDGTIALQIDAVKNADVSVKSLLTTDEKKSAAEYGHLGAYVYNYSDKVLKLDISLETAGGIQKLRTRNYSSDYYLLSDGNTGVTNAYALSDSVLTVPAGFNGYLIWHLSSYDGGADVAAVESIIFTVPSGAGIIVDNISVINDVDTYIANAINSKPDSDYLISDGDKVKISKSTITLSDVKMSSTAFRSSTSIRRGFYIVFNDGDDNQVFGVLKNLSDIKTVSVFQSGHLMRAYTVSNYVPKAAESYQKPEEETQTNTSEKKNQEIAKSAPLVDERTGISAGYYNGDAFPKGTELKVSPLANGRLPSDVYKYVKSKRYLPYEISLVSNGENIAIDKSVCFKFRIPDCFDSENVLVYRVTEDGWLEDMQAVKENGALVIYNQKTGIYILLQDADTNIGNQAGIYGIDVDEGMSKATAKKLVKHKGVREVDGFNPLLIIIPVALAVCAGAGAAVFMILRKKRKNKAHNM